jgi:glycosyltransferase involved in cell wall biosynthesis
MRILFLATYPAHESPSQRYRMEQYFGYLREKNIQFDYKPFIDKKTWKIIFRHGHIIQKIWGTIKGLLKRWLLMFQIGKYDFVYIHRETVLLGPPVFEWIIAKIYKKKIIYDFDDAIWIPFVSKKNGLAFFLKFYSKIGSICKWSYKISVGNSFLGKFAQRFNQNIVLIPTVVNTDDVHNRVQQHDTDKPIVGWTGSFSTLKFLDVILPVLQRMQEKYDFEFIVIADQDPHLPLKYYRFIEWNRHRETDDLLNMHIGLMPLYDDELTKGKCGFKAIQYMSLGIPPIVSGVGVNPEIVEDGVDGFVCYNENDWEKKLTCLLNNTEKRKIMGKNAREKIQNKYSVAATKDCFLKLFAE